MPLYRYKCPKCLHEAEVLKKISECDSEHYCSKCKTLTERVYHGVKTSRIKTFENPLTLHNINVNGEGPVTFRSKSELRRYCKENGLESGALL